MADESVAATAPAPAETKRDIATRIYTAWRNMHLNELPVEIFHRLEAASEHLIAEIEALL